jgi:transposase
MALDGLRAAASNMAIQRLDEALLQAAEGVGAAPTAFTEEQIKWVTDKGLAKTTTQSAICKALETRFNVKIDQSTLSKYPKVYRCTGTYWDRQSRSQATS